VNAEVAKHQRFAGDRMDTHKNAALTPTACRASQGQTKARPG
jgi:hypothetical protein